jgi:tRNA threonylcarbamoyladenosine biosynthesis protein TsaB
MTKILVIDTTSKQVSVGISFEDVIQTELNFFNNNDLTKQIIPAIDFILSKAGLTLREIDAFGIAVGPGFFTGIRIGLSTLKGLLIEMSKPIVPVSSLKALAWKLSSLTGYIIPLIDAKREELYVAGYQMDESELKEFFPPSCLNLDSLLDRFDSPYPYYFVGNEIDQYRDELKSRYKNARFITRSSYLATEICQLTFHSFIRGEFITDLQDLLPLYIRKPDAEMPRTPAT